MNREYKIVGKVLKDEDVKIEFFLDYQQSSSREIYSLPVPEKVFDTFQVGDYIANPESLSKGEI